MINFIDRKVKIMTIDNNLSEGEVIITSNDHLCLDKGNSYSFIYFDKIIWIEVDKEELFKDIPLEDEVNEPYEITDKISDVEYKEFHEDEEKAVEQIKDIVEQEPVSEMYIPSSMLVEEEEEKIDNTFSISFSGTAESPWLQERK